MSEITIKSYGKVNLSLDITGVREDGYHELETVMQQISICDEVMVKWTPCQRSEIKLSSNKSFLPCDERNIAYKAASLMVTRFGEEVGSGVIEIFIDKRLPVAAGLAGGSGNGAAVVIALNRLWKLGLDTKELCRISSVLGADVPFCLLTQNTGYGCALCTGTGTELTPLKSRFRKSLILVKPAFGVSTKEVYQNIDDCVITERPATEALIGAIKKSDEQTIYKNMVNVLEAYTLNKYPEVMELKEKIASETSAEKVLMTGSGPTVVGMFGSVKSAQKACSYMRKQGFVAYWATTM